MSGISLDERHRRESVRREIALMKLEEAQVAQTLKVLENIPTWARDEDEDDWILDGGSATISITDSVSMIYDLGGAT